MLGILEQMVRDGLSEKGFVDEAIVSEMISGIEDDSKCRRGTLLCAPHVGGRPEVLPANAEEDKG